MLYGHSNHCLVYYNFEIFVIAGCDETNKFTNKCEKYHLETKTWQKIIGTNSIRDSCAAFPFQNKIYLYGGRVDNGMLLDNFEIYDIYNNLWTEIPFHTKCPANINGFYLVPSNLNSY